MWPRLEMFSPGIWWRGLSVKRSGCFERACGGHERDADDKEIEEAPRITEECGAKSDDPAASSATNTARIARSIAWSMSSYWLRTPGLASILRVIALKMMRPRRTRSVRGFEGCEPAWEQVSRES